MLQRDFYAEEKSGKKLDEWLKKDDALLILGARQVGKSYLVREWGRSHFKSFIEINLYEKPGWIPVIEEAKGADDLLFRITSLGEGTLIEGETLIFFDEIQCAKKVDLITLSKFLVQKGKYRYIFSGSMLGVSLNENTASWPTGYMEEFSMYPLDFEEFLRGVGLGEDIFSYLRGCFEKEREVDKQIHESLIDAFYKYLLIGGMPEAVSEFVAYNDLSRVNDVHAKIDDYYKKDITKCAPIGQRVHLETIYKVLPQELNSKSKRFTLGEVGRGRNISDIQDDFMWLKKAGVAIPACNVDEPKIPLAISTNSRLVKLFHCDVGMLSHSMMDTDVQLKLLAKEKSINYGAIFENAIAQELTAHGFDDLHYYSSKKQGEVDFLIECEGSLLPIEVKSGKDYKRHSALNNLLANRDYEIKKAVVFSNANVEREGKVLYLPIYMAMFYERRKPLKAKISLDLSGLKIA